MDRIASRVLIVEDEWLLAEAISNAITAGGCEVVGPVRTVKHALELLETEQVTAACLDVSLNDTSHSFPIARALQARNVPFCFISGYTRHQLPKEFHHIPLFVKPCEVRVIREQILALISPPTKAV